jgi:hypothetical protein
MPEAVLVSADGEVRLRAFGFTANSSVRRPTDLDLALGRIPYLSPEALDGVLSPGSDLFSLGVLLWEGLARHALFTRDSRAETEQEIRTKAVPALSEMAPGVPGPIVEFVHKLLARNAGERFSSAADAKFALQKALFGLEIRTGAKEIGTLFQAHLIESGVPGMEPETPDIRALGGEQTLGAMVNTSVGLTKELTRESNYWISGSRPSASGPKWSPESAPAALTGKLPVTPSAKPVPETEEFRTSVMLGDLETTVKTAPPAAKKNAKPAIAENKTKFVELTPSAPPAPAAARSPAKVAAVRPQVAARNPSHWPKLAAAGACLALVCAFLVYSRQEKSAPGADTAVTGTPLPPAAEPERVQGIDVKPLPSDEGDRKTASLTAESDQGELEFRGEVLPEFVTVDGKPVAIKDRKIKVPLGHWIDLRLTATGYKEISMKLKPRSDRTIPVQLAFEKAP